MSANRGSCSLGATTVSIQSFGSGQTLPRGATNKERHGTTPLHLAVRSGSVAVVAALLAGGADPRRRDSHGWTPRGLLQECAARKGGTVSPATPVNAMRDEDRARDGLPPRGATMCCERIREPSNFSHTH